MPKLIDLSITIANSPDSVPEMLRTKLVFVDHQQGAQQIESMFGIGKDLLRRREGWAVESFVQFGTHNSTHVDAPWHYNSEIGGQRAQTIDELPLDWFFAPAVVLDMRHKERGDAMSAAEAEADLDRVGHQLRPLDIVLIRTGCDAYIDEPDYMWRGCGVSAEATHWLYQQGVRVMGIDAWGWDAPLDLQASRALEQGEAAIFWQAHQADLAYSQIERLCNLSELPATGFRIACFPLKIKGGSGAPARVVGIVEDAEVRA